jgi:hypothetical protein
LRQALWPAGEEVCSCPSISGGKSPRPAYAKSVWSCRSSEKVNGDHRSALSALAMMTTMVPMTLRLAALDADQSDHLARLKRSRTHDDPASLPMAVLRQARSGAGLDHTAAAATEPTSEPCCIASDADLAWGGAFAVL